MPKVSFSRDRLVRSFLLYSMAAFVLLWGANYVSRSWPRPNLVSYVGLQNLFLYSGLIILLLALLASVLPELISGFVGSIFMVASSLLLLEGKNYMLFLQFPGWKMILLGASVVVLIMTVYFYTQDTDNDLLPIFIWLVATLAIGFVSEFMYIRQVKSAPVYFVVTIGTLYLMHLAYKKPAPEKDTKSSNSSTEKKQDFSRSSAPPRRARPVRRRKRRRRFRRRRRPWLRRLRGHRGGWDSTELYVGVHDGMRDFDRYEYREGEWEAFDPMIHDEDMPGFELEYFDPENHRDLDNHWFEEFITDETSNPDDGFIEDVDFDPSLHEDDGSWEEIEFDPVVHNKSDGGSWFFKDDRDDEPTSLRPVDISLVDDDGEVELPFSSDDSFGSSTSSSYSYSSDVSPSGTLNSEDDSGGYDSGYDNDDDGYDSGYDNDDDGYDSSYDNDNDGGYDSGYDNDDDGGYDSGYDNDDDGSSSYDDDGDW